MIGLFFLPVLNTEQGYKEEKAKLQREIAAAEEDQAQLNLETEHMKNDPAFVEHIARDQLNMGKPGETIIRFDKYQAHARNCEPPSSPRHVRRKLELGAFTPEVASKCRAASYSHVRRDRFPSNSCGTFRG